MQTDNKVSTETILVKNLINDFYLVGHKQFTENRVEEENESKLFGKSTEDEESFHKKSIDPDTQIHEQMQTALDNSLLFVKAKLNDLKQLERSDDSVVQSDHRHATNELNYDKQVERLIKCSKYNQKKLPPIVNSDEFMNDVFSLVKQRSTTTAVRKKVNSSSSLAADSKTETSSISLDVENISLIDEKILEINENNFTEHLAASTQQSAYGAASRTDTDSERNLKSSTISGRMESSSNLDQSQTYKPDKIEIANENVNENAQLRSELDAIFGKASSSAKNRLFEIENDSDDELFQPSQSEKRPSKDLFKSDSSIDSIQPTTSKATSSRKTTGNLFESNVKSSVNTSVKSTIQSTIQSTGKATTSKSINKPTERVQSNQVLSKPKNILDKLFDSDSEDDQLFTARLPTKEKSNLKKVSIEDTRRETKPKINKSSEIFNKEIEPPIEQQTKLAEDIGQVTRSTIEIKREEIDKLEESSKEDTSSGEESLDGDKMSNKKELFKNQLEGLFAKKRNPNQGLIKVNREPFVDDSDNEKNKENKSDTTSNAKIEQSVTNSNQPSKTTSNESNSSTTSSTKAHQTNQRKDPISSSTDLFSDDLSPINTSTLDNNLVKSRVKPNNRKRPTNVKPNVQANGVNQLNSVESKSENPISVKTVKEPLRKQATSKDSIAQKSNEIDNRMKGADKYASKDAKKDVFKNKDETTKKKALFDESSDEDDFFKELGEKSEKKQSANKTLDKFKTLFDSDDDDLLFTSKSNKAREDASPNNKKSTSDELLKKESSNKDLPKKQESKDAKPATSKLSSNVKKPSN